MAIPRWVEFYTASGVGLSNYLNAGHTQTNMYGRGTPPNLHGAMPPDIPVTLTSSDNQLLITMNDGASSSSKTFTLSSGTNLDLRMLALELTERMHKEYPVNNPVWTSAYCFWDADGLTIRNGVAGSNSMARVDYTANSAATKLGFSHGVAAYGTDNNRLYNGELTAGNKVVDTWSGSVSLSGTSFADAWDEYMITAINSDAGTGQGTAQLVTHASGTYAGTLTFGGAYNYTDDTTYHIAVTVSGSASYMNGIKDAVPVMSWYGVGGDTTSSGSIQLLYPDYPYPLGNKGLNVTFSNYPFSYPGNAWQIQASGILTPSGYNYQWGSAFRKVIWSSIRGDDEFTPQDTASYGNYFRIGRKGVYISADQNYNVAPGDVLRVRVPGPVVYNFDVTSIDLGNITVTTASRVFAVGFDLIGGAVALTNAKFGLLDDGGMGYHDGVNTKFMWGTVGPGQPAVNTDYDVLWREGVVSSDLVPPKPDYLYAIDENLTEVSTADDSKTLGISSFDGLRTDFIYCAIQLGADESGAKTATYRLYYDYTE